MKLNIKPLKQGDAEWKNEKLGKSTTRTIGSDGCLLVCHTMSWNWFGYNFDPSTLNEHYKKNDVFVGALIMFHKAADALDNITADEFYNCLTVPCDTGKIDRYLNEGKPVIAFVDNVHADNKPDHFVLIIGKDENEKYLVNDPVLGETVYFHAVWGDDPARSIYGLRLYSGPVPEDDCETKLAELQANYEKTNEMLSIKTDEVSIQQAEIRVKDAKIEVLQAEVNKERTDCSDKIYVKDKEIAELKKEVEKIDGLQNKIKDLEDDVVVLEESLKAVRMELKACKQGCVTILGLWEYLKLIIFK